MLTAFATSVQADDMKKEQFFTMTSYTDHVSFEILLTDLWSSNTWAKQGTIRAYSQDGRKGDVLWLMDVQTKDWDDDDKADWDVFARVAIDGAKAWFTNMYGGGEKEITRVAQSDWNDNTYDQHRYTLNKGYKKDDLTAKIDFYFPAEMAGKKWYFYYEYLHSGGTVYNMRLGEATLSTTVGCKEFNHTDYSYERKGPDKIVFTVPGMPDDVPQKLKGSREHVGVYSVGFTYTLMDNSTKYVKERLQCQTGSSKKYEITIPEEVGNYYKIEMAIEVQDGLKDAAGNYFWNNKYVYNKYNYVQFVPVPGALSAEYRQFEQGVELTWDAYTSRTSGSIYQRNALPYVYRMETDKNGKPVTGQSWVKKGTLDPIDYEQSQAFTDKNIESNSFFKYMVVNVPQEWIDNKSITASDLNSPSEKLLKYLGYAVSDLVVTSPTMSIFHLEQDITVLDKVRLTWEYSRIPVEANTVTFKVWRREKGTAEWSNYGNVTADANPAPGTVMAFVDNDLPSNRVSYEYKIVLALNDGKNTFESDVITAGLLSGTTVSSIEATKGTHENTVRVKWKARQVGTETTTYELYRRYAGSNDEFLQIYTTTGAADNYTYEDNTVQPGYYYEYKVEAYSGAKADYTDNTYQNSLSDVGFSQSRGVVSGRVSFGTGTAVEDVRISLRSSGDNDNNSVRGYAQHVEEASTGLAWVADSTETAKVFDKEKDFTLQMFVRPDGNLTSGAVFAEVPYLGRLRLGDKVNNGYELLVEKYSDANVEKGFFSSYSYFRTVFYYKNYTNKTEYTSGYGTVYGMYDAYDLWVPWMTDGFEPVDEADVALDDMGNPLIAMKIFKKEVQLDINSTVKKMKWEGTVYDTKLVLPSTVYSMLTLQKDSKGLTLMVNNDISSTLTERGKKQYSSGLEKFSLEGADLVDGCLFVCEGNAEMLSWQKKVLEGWHLLPPNGDFTTEIRPVHRTFAIGGSEDITTNEAFKGNITEVRVWDHVLSDKEWNNVADRVLNGREAGLKLYWPMDEGLNRYVFDASYANDVPNGRHATVGNNISTSTLIPSEEQLSRYGLTNASGDYTIRGIPFVGTGTAYVITPSKGIHEFSPQSRNGFIGTGSLALNNFDFTDQSSFPVRGSVTYLNTNIPADSIQFKIDGSPVQSKNGVSMTDSNGEYEISVPIGPHLIEAYRNGHRLTSFPLDGTTYDFHQAETINFIDSTLVNVTGRINGGYTDQDEPLGFQRSVNRLGKATIKLSLGKESQCSFNYILNEHGEGSFGTTNLPVESATDKIASTAYRAGGSHDDTYFIYITTDAKTGEFSAMLPPLKYKVESIMFDGGTDYDDLPVFAQNLPLIDATNTAKETMKRDSLVVNGSKKTYDYAAKMVRQYRAEPIISVSQTGMKNGAFGEIKVPVSNIDNTTDSIQVVKFTDKSYEYLFDYPLFRQDQVYEFDIDVSERYVNLDSHEVFEEVPKDAEVYISNDGSMSTTVFAESATIDGREVAAGTAYNVQEIRAKTDEYGHVTYKWVGGWPNLAEGYLRNLNIGVTIDGRFSAWKAPHSQSDALDLVILGSLVSGTNFVTRGPDKVDMVLRRPPGSTSVASLQDETITAKTITECTTSTSSEGGGVYVSLTPTFEIGTGTLLGVALIHNSKFKIVENNTLVWTDGTTEAKTISDAETYSVTEQMKTPSGSKFVQNSGDTYIGRSSNLLFGKGRSVNIFKGEDGVYRLGQKETVCVGQSFETKFVYPQQYIEGDMIPNWQAIIDSKLVHVEGDHLDPNVAKPVPGKVMYYTKYKKGDPEYGRSNGDEFWTKEQYNAARGYPSYSIVNGTDEKIAEDEVNWYIEQIRLWRERIADNECDKLTAFEDNGYLDNNYSIAGGTSVSKTDKTQKSHNVTDKHTFTHTYNGEMKFGLLVNDAGGYGILKVSTSDAVSNDTTEVNTSARTVAWTLSDAEPTTALSVDVYKSPRKWGPIFRTRGGQTSNPYEDATYTKYYKKGTKLDESTMRVEYPQLRVEGATAVSDVPVGGKAQFKLLLTNLSETKSNCTYILEAIESSNAKGAVLTIDGAVLSMGRTGRAIKMTGDQTIEKMLYISQSDRSATKYDDIKLVLRSEKDIWTHSDTVRLSVQFVPASAIIDLAVNHTVLNRSDLDAYGGFQAKLSNLDRQDNGLRGVRMQYRRKGTDTWSVIEQWSLNDEDWDKGYKPLPEGNSFTCPVAFTDDGEYELRAQTFGKYGSLDVTYETDIISVVQDLRGPKILGMPSPANGLLYYNNRNDMHVRFNELINSIALSKTDNFIIEGNLNNKSVDNAYNDVAYQLNVTPCSTQSNYKLEGKDVAIGMWFCRQSDGTIINLGEAGYSFNMSTINGGKVLLGLGTENESIQSDVELPLNTWTYIAVSYKHSTMEDPHNYLTVMYTKNDTPVYVVKDLTVNTIFNEGTLSIGGFYMTGMMRDLTLWNTYKSVVELLDTRNMQKASFTPGLIGYWRMDEGHGTTLTDKVRSRDIQLEAESWYINNRNKAAHLNGEEPLRVDISTFAPRVTDNYAVEMWFRADPKVNNENAQLLSALNCMSIGFNDKKLTLAKSHRSVGNDNVEQVTVEDELVLTDKNYIDSKWHHLALNVHRGTSAIVYIDGQAVKTIPEGSLPAINSHYLVIGGEQTILDEQGTAAGGAIRLFEGDIDEVRIWNAALSGDLINQRRYERLDSTYSGLIGYFPMESIHREPTGEVTTEFSTLNFGNKKAHQLKMEGSIAESLNAPALLPGSQRMRLDKNEYDVTASSDEIYFSFPDHMLAKLDGNDFTVTIENIKDEHGNSSESVAWTFHADLAALEWKDDEIDIEKKWNENSSVTTQIINVGSSGDAQSYEIMGMPSWMTVSEPVGKISQNMQQITIEILPSVPVGRYTEYLYVSDSHGIQRALQLNIKVTGNEPDWAVNPDLYESNMTVCGQLFINGKIDDNPDSKVAAFDADGNCRGVASPKYVGTRDAYYVNMVVYGGAATELSGAGRDLTFQMYDANTGRTYPVVNVKTPDGNSQFTLRYSPDAIYGSYDEPLLYVATDNLLQTEELQKGWTWMSIFVNPASTAIADVLPQSKDDLRKVKNIKGHNAIASVSSDGSKVMGELKTIEPGHMYKIQTSAKLVLKVTGSFINVRNTTATIYPGFNWIGSLSNGMLSPEQAFADLSPVNGDMVKARTAFSTYRDGVWEGELQSIVPGVGYIYMSKDTLTKNFHYPQIKEQLGAMAPSFTMDDGNLSLGSALYYEPVDEHLFPDNMNFIAVVKKDGVEVETAEVAAFVNGECRGAVTCNNGYYFLTILGSSVDDLDATVEIRVRIDGEEYTVASQPFVSDAMFGSLDEPYVLDVDATAIRTVLADDDADDTEWYTLQGQKIGRRPTQQGVYIHRGEKVTIRRDLK